MKVSIRSRRMIRLQNILFVVLFLGIIGLLAWLSTRYTYQADWTATGRNTLSAEKIKAQPEVSRALKTIGKKHKAHREKLAAL